MTFMKRPSNTFKRTVELSNVPFACAIFTATQGMFALGSTATHPRASILSHIPPSRSNFDELHDATEGIGGVIGVLYLAAGGT